MILRNNNLLSIFLGCIAVLFIGCNKDMKTQETSAVEKAPAVADNVDPDCVGFVALWSASDIAERTGKDKKWVMFNYTFDLWDIPASEGKGNMVGKINVSTYGRIIEKREDAYKIESPRKEIGWISTDHVKTTSWKNPKTRKLCK